MEREMLERLNTSITMILKIRNISSAGWAISEKVDLRKNFAYVSATIDGRKQDDDIYKLEQTRTTVYAWEEISATRANALKNIKFHFTRLRDTNAAL